eukprot:8175640-Alexandrium_andersonii.AAC.1
MATSGWWRPGLSGEGVGPTLQHAGCEGAPCQCAGRGLQDYPHRAAWGWRCLQQLRWPHGHQLELA